MRPTNRGLRMIAGGLLFSAVSVASVACSSSSHNAAAPPPGTVAPACAGGAANTVALTPESGREVAAVCIGGTGPYQFVVDTGAPATLVTSQLASQLKLAPAGSAYPPVAIGCVNASSKVNVDHWSLGGLALQAQKIMSANVPGFGGAGEPQGVIGGDVLGRFGAVRIDFNANQLRVSSSEGPAPKIARILEGSAGTSPPSSLTNGRPKAAAALTLLQTPTTELATARVAFAARETGPFVIATGYGRSEVSAAVARSAHLAKAGSDIKTSGPGCASAAQAVEARSWTVASVPIPATPIASVTSSLPEGAAGVVGSDVLSTFGSMVLDYRAAVLWLDAG